MSERRDDADVDVADWGPSPSGKQVAAALAGNEVLLTQMEANLRAGCVTLETAARIAQVPVAAIRELINSGELAAIADGRLVPSWQLAPGSPDGVLPGVAELSRAFPGDLAALTMWTLKPSVEFDGRRPRDLLEEGRAEEVIAYAGSLTAAGW